MNIGKKCIALAMSAILCIAGSSGSVLNNTVYAESETQIEEEPALTGVESLYNYNRVEYDGLIFTIRSLAAIILYFDDGTTQIIDQAYLGSLGKTADIDLVDYRTIVAIDGTPECMRFSYIPPRVTNEFNNTIKAKTECYVNNIKDTTFLKEEGLNGIYDENYSFTGYDDANVTNPFKPKSLIDPDSVSDDDTIPGDINADGRFNVADLVILHRFILGLDTPTLKNWEAADLCKDGCLNAFDMILMRRLILEQLSKED